MKEEESEMITIDASGTEASSKNLVAQAEEMVRIAEERIAMYQPAIDLTLNYFNYKQRRQYNIRKLQFVVVPQTDVPYNYIRISVLAIGGTKAKDMRIADKSAYPSADRVIAIIDQIIAEIMRYGLKHLYINGVETSEDAFL
jgi:hypothetical protein